MTLLFFQLLLLSYVIGAGKIILQYYDEEQDKSIDLHSLLENVSASLDLFRQNLNDIREMVSTRLAAFEDAMRKKCDSEKVTREKPIPRNCAEIYKLSSKTDGVYLVQPTKDTMPFEVFCDMTTDRGGWTVFQRRGDYLNSQRDNFYRSWQEYKTGFGDLNSEFWLGNEKLFLMTKDGLHELRVDMKDGTGQRAFAKFRQFQIQNEDHNYGLMVSGYYGNAGDSLSRHNGMQFSTRDRDNDIDQKRNCARLYQGAWWYADCLTSNLNGLNLKGSHNVQGQGIEWYTWKGEFYSIFHTEMKFRPEGF